MSGNSDTYACTARWVCLSWFLSGAVLFGTAHNCALAQSVLLEAAPGTLRLSNSDDAFAIGTVLHNPRTLQVTTLEELIELTAGKARQPAFVKYVGDFDAYWKARKTGAAGKAFEAIEVFEENRRLASMGDGRRYILTAVEGRPGHAADVVEINRWGKIRGRLQFKAGSEEARKALDNPKFAGMRIVTCKDSLDHIKKKLSSEMNKAARRGLTLSPKWQRVRDAIKDGRLLRKWPSGASPSSRSATYLEVERVARKHWHRLAKANRSFMKLAAKPLVLVTKPLAALSKTRLGKILGSAAGKGLVVVDVAANVYLLIDDFTRWNRSEIGGGYFGFKAGLRSAQIALTAYAFWAPDPSLVTKLASAGGALLLIVADIVSDPFYAAAQDRTRQLLLELERAERYHHCRRQILVEMDRAIKASSP